MPAHQKTNAVDGSPAPAVVAEDLHVVRGQTAILRGVTCEIPAGGCTAILGPNGCGKTTFTRALSGQTFLTTGRVRVLGRSIGETDIRALMRHIAIVNPTTDGGGAHMSGSVVDADLTALEAVVSGFFGTVGLYDRASEGQRRAAGAALGRVGLRQRSGLRFGLLSTGEQRRCLIARALVKRPRLLILDEPTAGLDMAGREQVLETVEGLLSSARPPTVLFITHRLEELPPGTLHVLLMKEGRIFACGPPGRVLRAGALSVVFGCKVSVRRWHGRWWPHVAPGGERGE